jgi:hypothetical protein
LLGTAIYSYDIKVNQSQQQSRISEAAFITASANAKAFNSSFWQQLKLATIYIFTALMVSEGSGGRTVSIYCTLKQETTKGIQRQHHPLVQEA